MSGANPIDWLQLNHHQFSVIITQGAGTISKLHQKIQNKWQ
jgi:hypothetical protein